MKPRGYQVDRWIQLYFADIMKDNDVETFKQIIDDSHRAGFTREQLAKTIKDIFNTDTRGNNGGERDYKSLLIEIERH